jgi:hypothetical protein
MLCSLKNYLQKFRENSLFMKPGAPARSADGPCLDKYALSLIFSHYFRINPASEKLSQTPLLDTKENNDMPDFTEALTPEACAEQILEISGTNLEPEAAAEL